MLPSSLLFPTIFFLKKTNKRNAFGFIRLRCGHISWNTGDWEIIVRIWGERVKLWVRTSLYRIIVCFPSHLYLWTLSISCYLLCVGVVSGDLSPLRLNATARAMSSTLFFFFGLFYFTVFSTFLFSCPDALTYLMPFISTVFYFRLTVFFFTAITLRMLICSTNYLLITFFWRNYLLITCLPSCKI